MDDMLFSNMTLSPQLCATETEWGRPLMNSRFTLGLMIGISAKNRTPGATITNLCMTEAPFPTPLFEGDSIHSTTPTLCARASRSRSDAGIVELLHSASKPDGQLVAARKRQAFMKQRHIEV